MYCICCKRNNVKPYTLGQYIEQTEEDLLWAKDIDGGFIINNQMIDGGIIQIIEAGYGSTHDGDKLIIAICDDCINVNLEDATLLYYDDYLYPSKEEKDFIEAEFINTSKKKYRRRKNLDELV